MSFWVGCVDGLVGDGCGMADYCVGDFGWVDCVVVRVVVMLWGCWRCWWIEGVLVC